MDIVQLLLIAGGLMGLLMLAYALLSGPSAGKESQRRLQSLRFRHSDNTKDKVESQLKKAIAARKPKTHRLAGSGSRGEALAVRLNRTGRNWTVSQYLYTSGGIALVVAALLFLKSGSLLLSLGVGLALALACRTSWSAR